MWASGPRFSCFLSAVLTAVLGLGLLAAQTSTGSGRVFDIANDAWARGDYITALTEYIRLLNAPDGAEYFEAVALKTGELYQSFELTADGRNPRFSPDGRFISYETGLETSRRTRIVRNEGSLTQVADLLGISAAFSPTAAVVAYVKIADTPEIRTASQAVETGALTAGNRGALVQTLAWHILRNSTIAIRDLNAGTDRELPAPGLLKTGLAYSANGSRVFFLGRPEAQEGSNNIYGIAMTGDAAVPAVVGDSPGLKSAPIVDPSGHVVLYVVPGQDPLRRPIAQGSPGPTRFAHGERSAGAGGSCGTGCVPRDARGPAAIVRRRRSGVGQDDDRGWRGADAVWGRWNPGIRRAHGGRESADVWSSARYDDRCANDDRAF